MVLGPSLVVIGTFTISQSKHFRKKPNDSGHFKELYRLYCFRFPVFCSCNRYSKMNEVKILYNGYSNDEDEGVMSANCTCTLIKGAHNIIVDTMTAWDSDKIISALKENNLTCDEIHYVISTHGHSDHIGNNNLFLKAKHIVGFSISFKDKYFLHPFDKGEEYILNESVKVIPTPGHTLSDVTVIVSTQKGELTAIAGDLFEKFEDIEDANIWLGAGSENPELQTKNRLKVAEMVRWIIPGHGKMFEVTDIVQESLRTQAATVENRN